MPGPKFSPFYFSHHILAQLRDCDKTFGGEVNKRKTERGITKTVKENNMSVMLVREQVGDANSVGGDRFECGNTAPSVVNENKDVRKPADACR